MVAPLHANECQATINAIMQTPIKGTVSSFRPRLVPNPNPPPAPLPPPSPQKWYNSHTCPECSLPYDAYPKKAYCVCKKNAKKRAESKRLILNHQSVWNMKNQESTRVIEQTTRENTRARSYNILVTHKKMISSTDPAAIDLRRIAVQAIMGSKKLSPEERDAKIREIMGDDFVMEESIQSERSREETSESSRKKHVDAELENDHTVCAGDNDGDWVYDGVAAVAVSDDSIITVNATPMIVTTADYSMNTGKSEEGKKKKKRSSKIHLLTKVLWRLVCPCCCNRQCSRDHDNNPSVMIEKKTVSPGFPLLIKDHHSKWVLVENYEVIDAVEVAIAVRCDDYVLVDAAAVSTKAIPHKAKVITGNGLLSDVLRTAGIHAYKYLHPKDLYHFSLASKSVHSEVSKGLIRACLLQIPRNFGSAEGNGHLITVNNRPYFHTKEQVLEQLLKKVHAANLRLLGTESMEESLIQTRRVLNQNSGAKFVSYNSELPGHLNTEYTPAGYSYEEDNKKLATSRCMYIFSRPGGKQQLRYVPIIKTWVEYILSQRHVVTNTWFWSCRHRNLDFQGVEEKAVFISSPHAEEEQMEIKWTRNTTHILSPPTEGKQYEVSPPISEEERNLSSF